MASAAQDVQRTFNDYIDGLMSSKRWNAESESVTFSFPDSFDDYSIYTTEQLKALGLLDPFTGAPTFTPAPDALKDSVRDFTTAISNLTGLKFLEVSGSEDRNANIRIAQSDIKGGGATTDYPGGGNALFGPSYGDAVFGNYWYGVIAHELGHALGLKEAAFSDGFSGGADFPVNVPLDRNDSEFTVMSYRSFIEGSTRFTWENSGPWDVPQSYMMLDIAALQYLYGANFDYNSGDTVYSWNPKTGEMSVNGSESGNVSGANRIFLTIWDGNGTDTYDMSNYTNGVSIDLGPGAWSTTSPEQLAVLSVDHGLRARGNVFNALQYRYDDPTEPNDPNDPPVPPDGRSLIENAIGGKGNDMIFGNDENNVLAGGLGRDFLNGREGVDTADYAKSPSGVKVSLRTHSGFDVGHAAEGDTLVLIENLQGSGFDDVLEGDDEVNVLDGLGGDDLIAGLGGADILEGNQGGDTADYFRSFAPVIVSLEAGTAEGGHADGDELRNIEGLRGSDQFGDILTGDAGVNFLNGLGGDDRITGRGGADRLWGGEGNDVFRFAPGAGRDRIQDFDDFGDDVCRLADFGARFDTAREVLRAAERVGDDVRITLASPRDDPTIIWLEDTRLRSLAAEDFDFA